MLYWRHWLQNGELILFPMNVIAILTKYKHANSETTLQIFSNLQPIDRMYTRKKNYPNIVSNKDV